MKQVVAAILVLIAPLALAGNAPIERYIAAKLKMLETQVAELDRAVKLMNSENLTETEKYERIGEPGFAAVDRALSESGYTLKRFYQFRQDNQYAIERWLDEHAQTAGRIEALQTGRDGLMRRYDQMINVYHGE